MGAERLTVRGKLMAASATIAHALLPGTTGSRASFAWPAIRSLPSRMPGRTLDPDYGLIERCLRGEDAAWEEMVKTHTRRVYSLCYRFTGKDSEAQDLSQEVFLRVFRTLKTFRTGEGTFVVWLSRLTRNLLIDNYRRNRLERATDSIEEQLPMIEERNAASKHGCILKEGPARGAEPTRHRS